MTTEEWRPVVGFPDYVVSDQGRVTSLKRGKPELLDGWLDGKGYRRVTLRSAGARQVRTVHSLVAEAFHGPRPKGLQIRHLDGNCQNNTAGNLRYGTSLENMRDRVAHGTNPNAIKTHCKRGHAFDADNTIHYRGSRSCRTCKRLRNESAALRAANVQAAA